MADNNGRPALSETEYQNILDFFTAAFLGFGALSVGFLLLIASLAKEDKHP